jgi:peptide chain release factor subunit 1
MSAIPTTTKLGPDQARIRDLLRRLAEAVSTDAPILSVYADVRPEAHGERPGQRAELTLIRDRLNAISDTLEGHGPARSSFDADRKRIERLLGGDEIVEANGIASFACDRIGLWETVTSATQFDTQVAAGPTAELFQLARLLDDSVAAVVAIVDTNTCRLFVTRRGELVERRGPDEPVDEHRRPDVGGWSQARFQRHVDMQDRRFAKEAAEAIERLVARERARHVILAGHERAIGVLEPELSESVRPLVDHVRRIDMRTSAVDVRAEVAPMLAALEEAEGMDVADRAIAGARAGELGVTGMDATMAALERGQVDELVIDETAGLDEEIRAELVRQAALTDARVEVVRDHAGLRRHAGVGATLRYTISA